MPWNVSPVGHFVADTDMNAELIAHGYSNALSGLFGGE
jgi:MFS superfamily sulfate permease-like transporter